MPSQPPKPTDPPTRRDVITRCLALSAAVVFVLVGLGCDPEPFGDETVTIENGGEYSRDLMKITIPATIADGHFAMPFIYDPSFPDEKDRYIEFTETGIDADVSATRVDDKETTTFVAFDQLFPTMGAAVVEAAVPGSGDWSAELVTLQPGNGLVLEVRDSTMDVISRRPVASGESALKLPSTENYYSFSYLDGPMHGASRFADGKAGAFIRMAIGVEGGV